MRELRLLMNRQYSKPLTNPAYYVIMCVHNRDDIDIKEIMVNVTELRALKWLESQGIVAYPQGRRTPDFITQEGIGYEVKLKMGNSVVISESQIETINSFGKDCFILVFDDRSDDPMVVTLRDLLTRKHGLNVIISNPKLVVYIPERVKWEVKMEATLAHENLATFTGRILRIGLEEYRKGRK